MQPAALELPGPASSHDSFGPGLVHLLNAFKARVEASHLVDCHLQRQLIWLKANVKQKNTNACIMAGLSD